MMVAAVVRSLTYSSELPSAFEVLDLVAPTLVVASWAMILSAGVDATRLARPFERGIVAIEVAIACLVVRELSNSTPLVVEQGRVDLARLAIVLPVVSAFGPRTLSMRAVRTALVAVAPRLVFASTMLFLRKYFFFRDATVETFDPGFESAMVREQLLRWSFASVVAWSLVGLYQLVRQRVGRVRVASVFVAALAVRLLVPLVVIDAVCSGFLAIAHHDEMCDPAIASGLRPRVSERTVVRAPAPSSSDVCAAIDGRTRHDVEAEHRTLVPGDLEGLEAFCGCSGRLALSPTWRSARPVVPPRRTRTVGLILPITRRLLTRLPTHEFDGSISQMCSAYGIEPR